jgi:hypothetical protein
MACDPSGSLNLEDAPEGAAVAIDTKVLPLIANPTERGGILFLMPAECDPSPPLNGSGGSWS